MEWLPALPMGMALDKGRVGSWTEGVGDGGTQSPRGGSESVHVQATMHDSSF